MKGKALIISLFVVMVAVQWLVPLQMIRGSQVTLSTGNEYKFKLAPVDPEDPFRGKYLNLSFEADQVKVIPPPQWSPGDKGFAILEEDDKGFARIRELVMDKPAADSNFIRVKVQNVVGEDPMTVYVQYPFDRYYINERMARPIEEMIFENQSDTTRLNYALVRVNSGQAALEKLYLDDIPLEEWYKRLPKGDVPEKIPQ